MSVSAVSIAPARAPGSASPPLRVAVIGVGRIGRMHAELLAHRVPGLALASVYDAAPDVAQAVGAELGADVPSTVDELLSADDLDAVAICSSTPTHAPLIEQAARAGKAILCEKPVSLTLAEVDRALAAVTAAGVPFQIGFNPPPTPPRPARRASPLPAALAAPPPAAPPR